MSDLKYAAKLALEALTATMATHGFREHIEEAQDKAIKSLEEALAKQEQGEPVAKNENGSITWLVDNWPQNCLLYTTLYTTPQQQKPLTDEQILADETLRYHFGMNGGAGPVSRKGKAVIAAIEAAHGIKE